ncbi:MC1R [Mytilus coruscus]|uniref:MC1R n=1 Tax=Mytilus coruscus TaxID=42192 RepID=A0A6J8ATK7_MYTCO|nr:MC1R [Mytilus coruscus]
MWQIIKIANFVIVTAMLLFHGCSIYVSTTSKELKKSRFLVLSMYLSLSDSALGLEFIYHNILVFMNSQGVTFQYQCLMIQHLIGGTVMSSLIQTLLICIERLNATFTTQKGILVSVSSNKGVLLYFILSHCIALLRFGMATIDGPVPCDPKNTTTTVLLFSHDIPCLCIVVAIISCYGVVLYRMIRSQNLRQASSMTESQVAKKKANAIRTRKNAVTLGLIIAVSLVAVLPRSMLVFYFYMGNKSAIAGTLTLIFNNFFILLNPVVDPIIYVLRIKKYRQYLRCKCLKNNSVSDVTNSTAVS